MKKNIEITGYKGSIEDILRAKAIQNSKHCHERIAWLADRLFENDPDHNVYIDGVPIGLARAPLALEYDLTQITEPTTIELAIKADGGWFDAGQEASIDWGDGSAKETVSATSGQSGYIGHTYTAAGTYKIKISGSMKMYGRDSNVDIAGQTLLTRVDSFGKLGITSFWRAFRRCTGLMSVPKTIPDSVTDMSSMFASCYGAAFNPDVSNWDVSNVTDMRHMFVSCSGDAFNPDVTNWDVSNVTNMSFMFSYCYGAAFNPDVSNWDVSNVTDMRHMFYSCYGAAFNPNMESWTLKTGVITTDMFTSSKTQPTTWLDKLLIAWADNSEQGNDITIDFSPNKFTAVEGAPLQAVADALAALTAKGWNITTANPYPAT